MRRIWKKKIDLHQRIVALDAKLERIWVDLDFIRTHLSSYVGDGIALTYLADATPIYNGGRYEEQNLEVLLSFLKDDTIFLDIGANVGFFSNPDWKTSI